MLFPRVIPVLTIDNNYLVKTKKYKEPYYVGDPFNALRIFNEKEVDEVVILDISNPRKNNPDYDFIRSLASEAFMPLCYGGHISRISHAEKLFSIGVEKISVNTAALESLEFVKKLSDVFGSQSIVVSIDVRKNIFGNYKIFHKDKKLRNAFNLEEYINILQDKGAGEIIITSTYLDGMRTGYDMRLYENLGKNLQIPLILNGGLGCVEHIEEAYKKNFSAFAGSSMFVFHGIHQAVLITYPDREIMEKVFLAE